MRVLVADKFEKSGLDGLAAAGCEVLFEPDVSEDALTDRIGQAWPATSSVSSCHGTSSSFPD